MIDEFGNIRCDTCGALLEVGQFPFCPHGQGANNIERDEIPGGIVLENYGKHPIRFDSHSERRRYMANHDLHEKEKFSPFPGTDRDPMGIPNPKGYVDPVTLENGRILIDRQQGAKTKDWDPVEAGVLRGQFSGTLTERDAKAVAAGDTGRMSRLGRRVKDAQSKG